MLSAQKVSISCNKKVKVSNYSFAGTAIFFEFKHFKPKRKQISTKCWTFMEMDEIKAGPACLEL